MFCLNILQTFLCYNQQHMFGCRDKVYVYYFFSKFNPLITNLFSLPISFKEKKNKAHEQNLINSL